MPSGTQIATTRNAGATNCKGCGHIGIWITQMDGQLGVWFEVLYMICVCGWTVWMCTEQIVGTWLEPDPQTVRML